MLRAHWGGLLALATSPPYLEVLLICALIGAAFGLWGGLLMGLLDPLLPDRKWRLRFAVVSGAVVGFCADRTLLGGIGFGTVTGMGAAALAAGAVERQRHDLRAQRRAQ